VLDESALGRFYAGVDCVAHVETFAGWANLAAEAMASGVPLVATPHGTLAFAEHEKTALVVPEPSPEALAKAILRLRDDPNLARQLAHAGRERIRSFSWNAYSADLLELAERPAFQYYAWSPDMGLFGKWPEAQRLDGLDPLLESCAGKSVLDLGAGEGVVSRRLLDRGAAAAHGFEYELSRVALANRIFDGFAGARFWQADLSNWGDFLARNASRLRASYDIVLYLGLHHHLPAATRMDTLAGAAKLSSDWFALRTPDALFRADNIEAAMVELGFSSVRQTGNSGLALGGSHIFRRRVPARSEREDLAHE
jgi:hypothetical protein